MIPAPQPGRAALITGASSGIGAELARQLAQRGHDLVVVARRRERLEDLAAELRERHGRRVDVVAADVSDPASREALVAEVERLGVELDVLVLGAGFGMGGPFLDNEAQQVTTMIRTNVEGVMLLSHALIPPMTRRRRGAVLIVSSLAGNQPMPGFSAYAGTKAALTSFAESMGQELRSSDITVTALCPGAVQTEFTEVADMWDAEGRTPKAFIIGAEECARAGLEGLERGSRRVMPRRAVRAFAWFGKHAPRRVWLPICWKLMNG